MTQQKRISTQFAYTVDTGSIKDVLTQQANVAASFADIRKAADAQYSARVSQLANEKQQTASTFAALRQAADQAYSARVQQLNAEKSATQTQVSSIEDVRIEAARLNDEYAIQAQRLQEIETSAKGAIAAEDSASKARQSAFLAGGNNSDGFSAQQIGSRVAGLGSIVGGSAGGAFRDVSQLVMLGSSLGVVGVAAGMAALAIKGYTDTLQASTERAKAFGDALEQAFLSTTSGIGDYQQKVKAQIAADTAARDALQKLADSASPQLASNLDNTSQSLANFLNNAAGSGDLYKPVQDAGISQEAYNAQVDDYTKKIQLAQIALDAYNAAIGANIVLVNDAVAGDKRINDSQVELAHANADAMNMTAAARAQEADSISAHITALEEAKDEYYITGAAADALNAEINSLENRLVAITDTTHSWADTLDDIAQRSTAVDNLFDAITAANEAQQKTIEAQNNLRAATDEHNAKLQSLEADDAEKRAEIAANAAEQRQTIDQKDADARAKILRDYNVMASNAIASRDALALFLARQNRNKSLVDEKTTYDRQIADQQKSLDKQYAQQAKALQKQQDAENASWNKQQAQLVKALNDARVAQSRADGLALGYQRQANDRLLNERIRANSAAETLEFTHQNMLTTIAYSAGLAIEAVAQHALDFVNSVAAQVSGITGGSGGGGTTGGGGGGGTSPLPGLGSFPSNPYPGQMYTDYRGQTWLWIGGTWQPTVIGGGGRGGFGISSFAVGTRYVSHDQVAILHQGERVLTAAENRASNQNVTINANFRSADDEQTWQYVRKRFMQAVKP